VEILSYFCMAISTVISRDWAWVWRSAVFDATLLIKANAMVCLIVSCARGKDVSQWESRAWSFCGGGKE
jgi:hypothetical protein